MPDVYEVLVPWCRENPGTDAERMAALQAETVTVIGSRFASFRTMAAMLSPEEYATVRTTLDTVAAESVLVADMITMLRLPGDDMGNGGGIDFGNEATRAIVSQLFDATLASKINGIAEQQVSQIEAWGVDVQPGHLASAREME